MKTAINDELLRKVTGGAESENERRIRESEEKERIEKEMNEAKSKAKSNY